MMEGSAAAAIICRHAHTVPYLQANVLRDQYTLVKPPGYPLRKVARKTECKLLPIHALPVRTPTYLNPVNDTGQPDLALTAILHPPPVSLYHLGPTWLTANDHTLNT